MEVLEELVELLNETAPYGQLLWNNKQVVPLYVPQQREAWAAVQTKKLDAVYLHLTGPKGRFAQGRIAGLGFDARVDWREDRHGRAADQVPLDRRPASRRSGGVS